MSIGDTHPGVKLNPPSWPFLETLLSTFLVPEASLHVSERALIALVGSLERWQLASWAEDDRKWQRCPFPFSHLLRHTLYIPSNAEALLWLLWTSIDQTACLKRGILLQHWENKRSPLPLEGNDAYSCSLHR